MDTTKYGTTTLCATMAMLTSAVIDIAARRDKVTIAELYRSLQAAPFPRSFTNTAICLLDEIIGMLGKFGNKRNERCFIWQYMTLPVTREGSVTREDLMRIADILLTLRAIRGCP